MSWHWEALNWWAYVAYLVMLLSCVSWYKKHHTTVIDPLRLYRKYDTIFNSKINKIINYSTQISIKLSKFHLSWFIKWIFLLVFVIKTLSTIEVPLTVICATTTVDVNILLRPFKRCNKIIINSTMAKGPLKGYQFHIQYTNNNI